MRCIRILAVVSLMLSSRAAFAFCGFYVAKADAQMFNKASQVVLVRDGTHTVITMSSDFKGEMKEFAVVVPVPAVLTKDQIHIGEQKLVQRIDGWSGPRLVEYFDPDPCMVQERERYLEKAMAAPSAVASGPMHRRDASAFGVTVEAQYTVGEYDIVILSAKQSNGLKAYLDQEGYKLPKKAAAALAPYVRQDMKFFVAKVNLKEQAKTGFQSLRPLQMAYDSPKFMLPIRLGMANADGPQDLIVYAITKKGRVESTNYHTVKMPSEQNVPLFVKEDFKNVYKAIFDTSYGKENQRGVFTEYAWSASSCDPCAEEPLNQQELKGLGVFWVGQGQGPGGYGAQPFITRLHVRYDFDNFPEDLVFQETGDSTNYQARYVLNHPFTGDTSCPAGQSYLATLRTRHNQELQNLVMLTGWSSDTVGQKMGLGASSNGSSGGEPVFAPPPPPAPAPQPAPPPPEQELPWYKRIWQ